MAYRQAIARTEIHEVYVAGQTLDLKFHYNAVLGECLAYQQDMSNPTGGANGIRTITRTISVVIPSASVVGAEARENTLLATDYLQRVDGTFVREGLIIPELHEVGSVEFDRAYRKMFSE